MTGDCPRPPSLEELSAYADDELHGSRRRQVARSVVQNTEANARLAAYRRQDDLLRLGLKGPALGAVPSRYHGAAGRAGLDRAPTRRVLLAAALALVVAVASGGWWLSRWQDLGRMTDEFARQAVMAHLSYAGADAAVPPSPEAAAAKLRDVVGGTLALPDLSRFGLQLVALRESAVGRKRGLLLRYEASTGAGAVSCYFARLPIDRETAFASTAFAGTTAVFRIDDGVGYAVVGKRPLGLLRRIAAAGFRYDSREADE